MSRILVLYYSRGGSTALLARQVCRGVDSMAGAEAVLRTVPPVTARTQVRLPPVPDSGPPYVTAQELAACDGLVMGSPARFGNMAAALKHFLESTLELWLNGDLEGKPFGLFTSSTTLHGGQETTLLSMALPLMHHGMIWVGLPYSEAGLRATRGGGSPYGASHVTFDEQLEPDSHESELARALGRRLAEVAGRLRSR